MNRLLVSAGAGANSDRGPLLRSLLLLAAVGVVLCVAIAWVFSTLIAETFGASQSPTMETGAQLCVRVLVACLAMLAVGAYAYRRPGPGAFVICCQLVFVVIPLHALTFAGYQYASSACATIVTIALLGVVVVAAVTPAIEFQSSDRGLTVVTIVVLALSAWTFCGLLFTGGLSRLNFDFLKVYDVRADFTESGAFPLSGYLVPWQGYVINPAALAAGFRLRRWWLVVLALALQIALFGMTNFRAFIFVPVLLAACAWLGPRRSMPVVLAAAAIGILTGAAVLFAYTGEPLIPSILIDRLLVIPAEIHLWYYDYFATQGHDYLLLTQSVLAPLGGRSLEPIAETIGWAYMGSNGSANVGLFGDAIANFGPLGCAAVAVLAGLLVRVFESLAHERALGLSTAIVAAPALQLVNSGLMTTLATHGLALSLVLLWACKCYFSKIDAPSAS